MWRARLEGSQGEHVEETLSNALRSFGVTEEGIGFFRAFLHAWRKARRDDEAFHTVDRYLVGAMGVFDLILFQMLVSVGHSDWASSLSMVAFIVSLPCTVGSLFLSFLKKEYKITVYGRGHGTMSLLSVISTFVSSTALIYHIWPVAGLLFFFIVIFVAILCPSMRLSFLLASILRQQSQLRVPMSRSQRYLLRRNQRIPNLSSKMKGQMALARKQARECPNWEFHLSLVLKKNCAT